MTFGATAVTVLVASPGDTQGERDAILRDLSRWNGRNAAARGFVLCPWLYELHATPKLGGRPQAIINQQGVDKADIVVAVFGHRLGTNTGVDVSGTVEEINRAVDRGKVVHVFFSASELPNDVDMDQLAALREFKSSLLDKGLLGEYRDPADLARQVRDAVENDMEILEPAVAPPSPSGPKIDVDFVHRTEPSSDMKGRPRTQHLQRDIVLKNNGSATAEQLTVRIKELDEDSRVHLGDLAGGRSSTPVDLTEGSSVAHTVIPFNGRASVQVSASWLEDGQPREQTWIKQVT